MKVTLCHPIFLEAKKLVLILAIFTPVTRTREETVEVVKTARADKDGKKSKCKYSENLAQVPYI